ncbi:MAG: hypothetical protein OSJ27_04370 [Candidatus Gastranaerophilales bacterium]|nr:hypothetical protein [Candidatus Gastranaerophilales bacterium]
MLTNLVSLITKSLASTNTASAAKVTAKPLNYNPFSPNQSQNPFMNQSFGSNENYAKNTPVSGGYFAGYYNGKPNIVGRKLFIEV